MVSDMESSVMTSPSEPSTAGIGRCWTQWPQIDRLRWQQMFRDRALPPAGHLLEDWLAKGGNAPELNGKDTAGDKPELTNGHFAEMPPDAERYRHGVSPRVGEPSSPTHRLPPVCNADLDFLFQYSAQRGAELLPSLRNQVRAATALSKGPRGAELQKRIKAGKPPLKGDDNKGDASDRAIFESFGVLTPAAWAAFDYSLSALEIFCPRPAPDVSLLPTAAVLSIILLHDHWSALDGCVGQVKDYTAGIYHFLPFLPSNAPGPAGVDVLLDQTAMTTFALEAEKEGTGADSKETGHALFDAADFMHTRLVDGSIMGHNALFTALGCSSVPCDELGWWNTSCPLARRVLETYMIAHDLVDFVSDCAYTEPLNLYSFPLLAGAPPPCPADYLRLGPALLQCPCEAPKSIHDDLFHTWVGALDYNLIAPRPRFARTIAWHARTRASGDAAAAPATAFGRGFGPCVLALLSVAGVAPDVADRITGSPAPLRELAAQCTLRVGRDCLELFADCLEMRAEDKEIATRASAIYHEWRRCSWGPEGRRVASYHAALKRDLILLACATFVEGTFPTMDAFVHHMAQTMSKAGP